MIQKKHRGRFGERLACDYLKRRQWVIVATNVHYREGEIDIVALDGPTHVFVEVKLRTSRWNGVPEEAVDHAKQSRLASAIDRYCADHEITGPIRVDLMMIEIRAVQGRAVLRHHRGVIFDAPDD